MKLFLAPFVVAWRLLVVVTPLLGIWLASSTVAFFGGWRELSLAGGVLELLRGGSEGLRALAERRE